MVQQAAPKVVSHEKPVFIPRPIREGRQRVFVDVENRNRNLNRHERRRDLRRHDHHHDHHNDGTWTDNSGTTAHTDNTAPEWSEDTSSE
ncbi:hypothetical protein ACIBI9_52340 [Nonomuraea sp. NPDC050451]|uniref:hypothetical protein n=1 Tax=Nonomuraea sp. NPDC050451 TaxID=3364364 RepID=UPI0037A72CCC